MSFYILEYRKRRNVSRFFLWSGHISNSQNQQKDWTKGKQPHFKGSTEVPDHSVLGHMEINNLLVFKQ